MRGREGRDKVREKEKNVGKKEKGNRENIMKRKILIRKNEKYE